MSLARRVRTTFARTFVYRPVYLQFRRFGPQNLVAGTSTTIFQTDDGKRSLGTLRALRQIRLKKKNFIEPTSWFDEFTNSLG